MKNRFFTQIKVKLLALAVITAIFTGVVLDSTGAPATQFGSMPSIIISPTVTLATVTVTIVSAPSSASAAASYAVSVTVPVTTAPVSTAPVSTAPVTTVPVTTVHVSTAIKTSAFFSAVSSVETKSAPYSSIWIPEEPGELNPTTSDFFSAKNFVLAALVFFAIVKCLKYF